MSTQEHWQNVYLEKRSQERSWYQNRPDQELKWIAKLSLPMDAEIVDVGAGDTYMVDHLLELGYSQISILDISEQALKNVQKRLGDKASQVEFIRSDMLDFHPKEIYQLWLDRAAFHFITAPDSAAAYVQQVHDGLKKNGYWIVGTFSDSGPTKCSGIEISQYNEDKIKGLVEGKFEILKSERMMHSTPNGGKQEFLYTLLQKIE